MPEGRVPITQPWWLCLIGQGVAYDVLETIQPVVSVDGIEMPPPLRQTAGTQGYAGGGAAQVVTLPAADVGKNRLWLQLWFNTSTIAATDLVQLRRGITGSQALVWQYEGNIYAAARNHPVIGGRMLSAAANDWGLKPQLATQAIPLTFNAVMAGAAGNFNFSGTFVDLPEQAVLPGLFWA